MGSNLFSVTTAMQKGIATSFHPDKPRLEYDDVVLPMNVIETDEVEYNGDVQACDVGSVGKSEQQAHHKQATYDVQRAFQLVTVDTVGAISPQALGGNNYVTQFVDLHTKWKEIFLIEEKTQSVDSLEPFKKGLVIPTGVRLDRLKADTGTEFTSSAFKQHCRDEAIKLDLLLPTPHNKLEQMSGQEGRLLRSCAACSPIRVYPTLWEDLMLTAVYISNRTPHAALASTTPYKTLYGEDAHLRHLRAIGARAFVHVETHTTTLDRRAREGLLVGYSVGCKSFWVYNPATRSVRESRNVVFIETPSFIPEPDLVSGFDKGDFTYDEYDDMVRDVWNYTSKLDLSSPPAADREVQDPSVRDILQTIRETINRDAVANRNSSDPPETPPVDNPSDDSPGGDSSASPEQGRPTGSGGGSESDGSSGISASGAARAVNVALAGLRVAWWTWCTRWPRWRSASWWAWGLYAATFYYQIGCTST